MADSEGFDRRQHRFPESRFFEDLTVGEHFYIPSRTDISRPPLKGSVIVRKRCTGSLIEAK